MIDLFKSLHPITQALIAGCFTWVLTGLGAGLVFVKKDISQKSLDAMLGFTAGVMIAASVWSLIIPAIEMSSHYTIPVMPALIGFMCGGIFLRITDKYLPHLHLFQKIENAEGVSTKWKRTTLLVLAITLHNIPEGLAVGVAFGAVAHGLEGASLGAAIALAIGIGIQNFPEGIAVSMPLRREGVKQWKCFNLGHLSAVVEPIFAVIGAALVLIIQPILPYALAFAAGAMIFVVIEEVVPESQSNNNADIATMGAMVGFCVMMSLDVMLG